MVTRSDHDSLERIDRNMEAIRQDVASIRDRLTALESRPVHQPPDCPYAADIKRLTLRAARQGGIFAVFGVALGLIASIIGGGVIAVFSRLLR